MRRRTVTQIPKFRHELDEIAATHLYLMGWRHGAMSRPSDPDAAHLRPELKEQYELGYRHGEMAYKHAEAFVAARAA